MSIIKVAEFRANIKECLDLALSGTPVVVERGGVHYQLSVLPTAFTGTEREREHSKQLTDKARKFEDLKAQYSTAEAIQEPTIVQEDVA